MAVKRTLLFMFCVAAVVSVGWCWVENAAERAIGPEQLASKTTMREAKVGADTWADWALHKFSEGIGMNPDKAKDTSEKFIEKAKEAASKSTDTMNSAAFESSRYASEKVHDITEKTSETLGDAANEAMHIASDTAHIARKIGMDKAKEVYQSISSHAGISMDTDVLKDKASNAYDYASKKADETIKMATDRASDAKDAMSSGKDKAYDTYVNAKWRSHGTYMSGKDMVSEKAKEKYVAGKETAAAARNVDGRMRTDMADI